LCCLGLLEPEEEGTVMFQNIMNYWLITTQSLHTKLLSATTLLLKSDVSHWKCLVLYDSDALMIFWSVGTKKKNPSVHVFTVQWALGCICTATIQKTKTPNVTP
jgi:hypothetical protein